MVVLPLLVFFLLKDKDVLLVSLQKIRAAVADFRRIVGDMDEQFGSYVRGKLIEAGLLFSVSWIAFLFLGLKYSFALALMIGFSVFVPFVGAVAVTFRSWRWPICNLAGALNLPGWSPSTPSFKRWTVRRWCLFYFPKW